MFQAAAVLALVAAPTAAQQSLDAGGLVYGLVGGGFGDGTFVATGAGAARNGRARQVCQSHVEAKMRRQPETMLTHGYGAISVSVTSAAADPAMEDFPSLPLGFDLWFPSEPLAELLGIAA